PGRGGRTRRGTQSRRLLDHVAAKEQSESETVDPHGGRSRTRRQGRLQHILLPATIAISLAAATTTFVKALPTTGTSPLLGPERDTAFVPIPPPLSSQPTSTVHLVEHLVPLASRLCLSQEPSPPAHENVHQSQDPHPPYFHAPPRHKRTGQPYLAHHRGCCNGWHGWLRRDRPLERVADGIPTVWVPVLDRGHKPIPQPPICTVIYHSL
ncbi:hypothetical protein BGZ59_002690, partial [Podila verticillata]